MFRPSGSGGSVSGGGGRTLARSFPAEDDLD